MTWEKFLELLIAARKELASLNLVEFSGTQTDTIERAQIELLDRIINGLTQLGITTEG